jgi:hypothetical protein
MQAHRSRLTRPLPDRLNDMAGSLCRVVGNALCLKAGGIVVSGFR